MKITALVLPLLVATLPVGASEVFRCAAGASVTYQEFPCKADAREVKIAMPQSFPEVNASSRDQLLAREAALDKRLEAERERLSREEIARIEARAKVAAAEAAAMPPEPVYPVYYAAWPAYRPAWRMRPPAHGPKPSSAANPWNPR